MNPWLPGFEVVMFVITVATAVVVFGTVIIVLFKRRRIEELMKTRPAPKPSKYRWLGVAIGAAALIAFEFVLMPHLLPRLSWRYHTFASLVGVTGYFALMSVFFSATQRVQSWPVASRLRFMYIMLAAAGILVATSLFHVFR